MNTENSIKNFFFFVLLLLQINKLHLQLDVFDLFQLIHVLMLLKQYHLLNAKEQYYNILIHQYDMDISYVILDR
jgi:hypothetical protein